MIAPLLLLALAFALVTVSFGISGEARAADTDSVQRGAYLAAAAGCEGCHTDTAQKGAAYAGGRVMATEFGPLTTPNLTPDRDTGLGKWSKQDFVRAMRWGVAPDDTHYVPVFPFTFYNRLSDGDLADLQAFLASLAPVSRPDLKGAGAKALWERARSKVALALTPQSGPFAPDAKKDAVWNRGAYLVATIGRCGQCHTPTNWLGVPDTSRFLAGTHAGPDGRPVPNITPDSKSGLGNWSEADLVQVLTDGHTPSFDEVGGAMAEVVKATARLTDDDRRAIAVYLQTVPSVANAERK